MNLFDTALLFGTQLYGSQLSGAVTPFEHKIASSTAAGAIDHNWPLLLWIPLFPLIGAALVWLLTSRRESLAKLSGAVATMFSLCSFIITVVCVRFLGELGGHAEESTQLAAFYYKLWTWFAVQPLEVDLAFRFDHLSAVMCLVVTGVGSLIHLYAIGYMEHDESRPRFFCYLNLFLFAMLILVLGSSLPVMFIGWEGVGLCSYLLIGFWYKDMNNTIAGQKAFVVNRIGDAGFLLGMFTLLLATGSSLDFEILGRSVSEMTPQLCELAAILLFIGAMGKSAQLPLHVWLPDAMAGPTPVSALIHAATMVTAGVYMIARMSPLFAAAPFVLAVIAIIGTLTAFVAATIALVQNDIKKVLAYSTVSQLGFMFMAMGSGAFSNGIYHVVTHAFFKACLFMGAGSVIIACHHEQDMRHYGGLWRKMPFTFATYLCATLAIAGIPFTSGFYSKDAILWTLYSNPYLHGTVFGVELPHLLWGVGLFTALLTAFYMTRSVMMTFFGKYRGHHPPHESPLVVTAPLVVLAFPSLLFGLLFGHDFLHYLERWTRSDVFHMHDNHTAHLLEQISMVVAVSGVALAAFLYSSKPGVLARTAAALPRIHRFLLDKWRIDELYAAVILRPLAVFSSLLFSVIDRFVVDGSVNGAATLAQANGDMVRRVHTGRIPQYALMMFVGNVAIVVGWLLFR